MTVEERERHRTAATKPHLVCRAAISRDWLRLLKLREHDAGAAHAMHADTNAPLCELVDGSSRCKAISRDKSAANVARPCDRIGGHI